MWYKVKELGNKGFNKSQISKETGLDRSTVRKYLSMNEKDFQEMEVRINNQSSKLSSYMSFVKKELETSPFLSSAQIEDHLKEHFSDFPNVHSKTVYNFVQKIRQKYDIPKPKENEVREFLKLPETEFGKEAQVDFGETYMQKGDNKRQKVYFFSMVLSRSRYKFIYFEQKPFTSLSSSIAHELCFEYFQGVPKEIIYDQDSVFIHDENLGDYLLTKEFEAFCRTQNFKLIFCRKADPQSKGKIENVVKYVKQNFLRGRKFTDIEALNKDGIAWLERTANIKRHSATQLIPTEEWQQEKRHLLPLKVKSSNNESYLKPYNVRKDNTIIYKSNFYSLPLGTYKKGNCFVFLREKTGQIFLYSEEKQLITTHNLSALRGAHVRNTDHNREKSGTLENYKKQALEKLKNTQTAIIFLDLLHKDKPRYFRDNLQVIISKIKDSAADIIEKSLLFCVENKLLNANSLIEIIEKNNLKISTKKEKIPIKAIEPIGLIDQTNINTEAEKSDIKTYQNVIESWN